MWAVTQFSGKLQCKIYVLILCRIIIISSQDVVDTKNGKITGKTMPGHDGKDLTVYYGIPYAKPPLGELRFASPQKAESWDVPLNVNTPPDPCVQQFTGDYLKLIETLNYTASPWSEDCLKINIFAPKPKPSKAPVVFFIHGGGFIVGSSLWWVDLSRLVSQGVVVAAVNYRLGVFGFMNLGLKDVTGNAGLLDQQMALKWVKDNIHEFGGDPNNISLLGCSAGSASVGFHLLSPGSRGLFKRVIMMSGTPTNSWAIRESENLIKKSKNFLNTIGCADANASVGLDCLRKKTVDGILEASLEPNLFLSEHFLPSVDGHFLVEHPDVSVSAKRFNEADVLIGTVIDDAAEIMKSANPDIFSNTEGRVYRQDFLTVINNSQISLSKEKVDLLNVMYTNWSNPDDPLMLRDVAKDLYTDAFFTCKANSFADSLFNSGRRVYRYLFDHKTGQANFSPGTSWIRATHGADHTLLLGPSEDRMHETVQDKQVEKELMDSIIHFVKTGNPNKAESSSLHWPQYNSKRFYKTFSFPSSIGNNLRTQQCATWLKLIPSFGKHRFC